jgi:hypothetical protein
MTNDARVPMAGPELIPLVACNVTFLVTISYIFFTRMIDRFVKYFLVGEYLIAMIPLSIIGILMQQTTLPIVLIFLIHISLLFILGVVLNYFQRKP